MTPHREEAIVSCWSVSGVRLNASFVGTRNVPEQLVSKLPATTGPVSPSGKFPTKMFVWILDRKNRQVNTFFCTF
jgi:hypothetical protein